MNTNKEIENIRRKEAIKKLGKFGKNVALTAVGTYIILNLKNAQAQSPDSPGTGF